MADVTTVTGLHIIFDPKSVSVVMDHNPNTDAAITCVYGLEASFVEIRQSAVAFLKQCFIDGNFVTFTRTNGFPVWINALAVSSLRSPDTSLGDPRNAGAVVSVGSVPFRITATPGAAAAAINVIRNRATPPLPSL